MGDVQMAIDKVNHIYGGKINLVPLDEMVDVLKYRKPKSELKLGAWVRLKRGKYKGDLAQIQELSESNDKAQIKIIPRLDFTQPEKGKRGAKSSVGRPAQRFFNPKDVPAREGVTR